MRLLPGTGTFFDGNQHPDRPTRTQAPSRARVRLLAGLCLIAGALTDAAWQARASVAPPVPGSAQPRTLTLQECLELAQRNNRSRPASRFAIAAAEAQHRQALAAYWPQVSASAGFTRLDDAPSFLFPALTTALPAQSASLPPSTSVITVPAGVLGPAPVQLPVSIPAQEVATAPQRFTQPAQHVKLLDRDLATGGADLKWLLYDGGTRAGLATQAAALVETMKQAARRTDLELADSVRRLYHGAVLARQLHRLGVDTLARLETTLLLTETLYQGGGGRVTKADFLDTRILVETVRALVARLEKNEAVTQAALANTLGLSWRESIAPADTEIPVPEESEAGALEALVGQAYRFSPDWKSFEAGLRAAEGGLAGARGGRHPRVALTGRLERHWNDYDAGLNTRENRRGWSLGVGLEIPLFDGALASARIAEMKARLAQAGEQGVLLREGIGLRIRELFLGLAAARKEAAAAGAALQAAVENRELNVRAYREEAVDTEKVVRAQLFEAVLTAQHRRARYEQAALQSALSLAVGCELGRLLQTPPAP